MVYSEQSISNLNYHLISMADEIVMFVDWLPTLMTLLGEPVPKQPLDGMDISPVLLGKGKLPERSIFFHFPIYLQAYNARRDDGRDPLFRTRPGSVIRKGNWKQIYGAYDYVGIKRACHAMGL